MQQNSYRKIITVYALPVVGTITGNVNICTGNNLADLRDTTLNGTWSSDNTAIATVDVNGLVIGVSQGTAIISYVVTNANGCTAKDTAKVTITLTPTVAPITTTAPSFDVCVGSTIPLKDATAGGTWSSSNGSIATISSTGVVTGVSAGTDSIFYTITTTCLQIVADTVIINVHSLPTAFNVTGGGAYCSGGSGVDISLSGSGLQADRLSCLKAPTTISSSIKWESKMCYSFSNQTTMRNIYS